MVQLYGTIIVHTADEYLQYLNGFIEDQFTEDYFTITLPKELTTSSSISPAWFGYIAAINVLGTPMLFSTSILAQHLVPGTSGKKNSIDRHHIFPKNYLAKIGYEDNRDQNQVANYTYLDYVTNIDIGDDPPEEYVARYKKKLGDTEFYKTCTDNALPDNFDSLSYPEFLAKRRKLMADIIRKGYNRLCV